jgi:hypothetical protein
MAKAAMHLSNHVIPHVPVHQWVLPLPITPRPLLPAQPQMVTQMLRLSSGGQLVSGRWARHVP